MKIIVTGAAGFLGSHLAEFHLQKGDEVFGIDNFCTGRPANVEFLKNSFEKFQFLEADVVQLWNRLPKNFENPEIIYHFASPASPPHYQRLSLETMEVNSQGLYNALRYAGQRGRVVFASTSEIYGDPLVHPQPESYWGNVHTLGPRACYDEAKRYGEALLQSFNERHNTRHGFVRIFNTYGPRMNPLDGRVVINFLVQALEGNALMMYGSGNQTRSFCYVDDLIQGIHAYAMKSDFTEPVNLGNDKEFTIQELAKLVVELFPQKNLQIEKLPLPKDDPRQRRPDLTLARRVLSPWAPRIELKTGLIQMIQWLAETEDGHSALSEYRKANLK